MQLTNFGEVFSARVLRKAYENAICRAITNQNYEGEIKKPGDRVNILSFLNDILLSDYTVGTNMASETIVDREDQLVVEKRKSYNFSLDRLEEKFTYAGDIPDVLIENASKVLAREMDSYVLYKAADAKAGSWIGINLRVIGGRQTQASIVTSATGGTVTLGVRDDITIATSMPYVEQGDGAFVMSGFQNRHVGKGFRLRSTQAWVSPWYRIATVTATRSATLTEWDGAVSGSDFHEGYTLRGIFGGDGYSFSKFQVNDQPVMLSAGTADGLGWEIQAARGTGISATSIYDQVTMLAEKLNSNEIPDTDRHLTFPHEIKTMLIQAAETQPTGIAEMYQGTVVNGKFMRMGGFDIHAISGARFCTRGGADTAAGADATLARVAGPNNFLIPANHIGFITYADKWSESRVVDAELQFAKLYQGLFLYGALVSNLSRKNGAILFGNF